MGNPYISSGCGIDTTCRYALPNPKNCKTHVLCENNTYYYLLVGEGLLQGKGNVSAESREVLELLVGDVDVDSVSYEGRARVEHYEGETQAEQGNGERPQTLGGVI